MADQFADLARVELELRADLAKYAGEPNPMTPSEVMPVIRAHPVMLVTARNKMGAGQPVSLSLAGQPRETVSFPDDLTLIRRNLEVSRTFVRGLGAPERSISNDGMHLWSGVRPQDVLNLINSYAFGSEAQVVNRIVLSNYINQCNRRGELTSWDIAIPRGNPDRDLITWAPGVSSRKVHRAPASRHSIGVLRSPSDLSQWSEALNRRQNDPRTGCLMLYAVDRASESRTGIRFFDRPENGEDIVGLMFIFPRPTAYVPVDYVSQQPLT